MAVRVYDNGEGRPPMVTWDMIGRVDVSQRRPCPTDGCGARQYRVEIQDGSSACSGARMAWGCAKCGAVEEDPKP